MIRRSWIRVASPYLNTTVQSLPVMLMDLQGRVAKQSLHSRIFDSYEAKNLILMMECNQQAGQQQPQQGDTAIAIDSWDAFSKTYNPKCTYHLVPRKTRNTTAFLVARALTMAVGSPFHLDHREDPFDFRYIVREGDQAAAKRWNQTHGAKYGSPLREGVVYDGILVARDHAALILTSGTFSERFVNSSACMLEFMKFWVDAGSIARYGDLRTRWMSLLRKKHIHLVCGADTGLPTPQIMHLATERGVHIYARQGPVFRFVPPPPPRHPVAAQTAQVEKKESVAETPQAEPPQPSG